MLKDIDGMTLIDYFAAKAMQGLIAKHGGYEDDMTAPNAIRSFSEDAPNIDAIAWYAYQMADAMMCARDGND